MNRLGNLHFSRSCWDTHSIEWKKFVGSKMLERGSKEIRTVCIQRNSSVMNASKFFKSTAPPEVSLYKHVSWGKLLLQQRPKILQFVGQCMITQLAHKRTSDSHFRKIIIRTTKVWRAGGVKTNDVVLTKYPTTFVN